MAEITIAQFHHIIDKSLPFARQMGLVLEEIHQDRVVMRAAYNEDFLRPGGTISGPVMMGLADAAVYAMVLSRIGPVELAVTTNLNINFLRKPAPGDLMACCRPIKIGRRLAVCEVAIYSAQTGPEIMVAHATATYSIPVASG